MPANYVEVHTKIVNGRQCSLWEGMTAIQSLGEFEIEQALSVCKNMGYDEYVPYLAARNEQLRRWERNNAECN